MKEHLVGSYKTGKSPLFFILLALLGLFACNKKEDNRIPSIEYLQPDVQQSFNVLDSIPILAIISDDKEITTVRVSLTNEASVPVSAAQSFTIYAPSYELNTFIPILDESLESGTYFILIRAENGVNFKNQYQEIFISGVETEFLQAIIITPGTLNQLEIFGTSDFDSASPLLSLSGDFSASAISSKDHLFFVAGKNLMNVTAVNLETNSIAWNKNITPGIPIHNTGCLHFDGLLYTSYNYDFIHGYTPSSEIGYHSSIEQFDAPERIYKWMDFVLVEVQKKNGNNPFIATHFVVTGQEKQRRFIDFDVVNFHSLDDNNVLVVANKENKGIIFTYDVIQDVLTLNGLLDDFINGSVRTSNQLLAIAGNDAIYFYKAETGSSIPVLNEGASIIQFEKLSESLLLGRNNELRLYSYPEMEYQKTLLFSDTILDIQIQYSK